MIACIFGLTACGSEKVLSQYDQDGLADAQQKAQYVVNVLIDITEDNEALDFLSERSAKEVEYIIENAFGIEVDGYGFITAIDSFASAMKSIGGINIIDGMRDFGEIKPEINGNQMIVLVEIKGKDKNAEAEIIFSNDLFLKLESAALNPESTMGELMTNAALNTVIGMGTVFVVLILISFIISCFNIIPKLQKSAAEKKAAQAATQESTVTENAVDTVVTEETSEDDDQELVAVIAAAIAAFEGSASTDGFVVRSIRRQQRM